MGVCLVALAGPSSSGKTTAVNALHVLLPQSTVVHLDDFYLPDSQIPIDTKTQVANWDCAEAIDWVKFKNYISDLRRSDGAILPVQPLELDLQLVLSQDEVARLHNEATDVASRLNGKRLIFVDGFMLFHDDDISRLFDVKLFFHAPYSVLKTRRESRPPYQTIEGTWEDPPHYFDKIVWPAYVESHKHLFIDNDVSKSLTKAARDMGINDIDNGNGRPLYELVEWALTQIRLHLNYTI